MTSKRSVGEPRADLDPDRAQRLADEAEAMFARDPRRDAAAVAMFERLSEHWSLRGDERETLLGGIPKSTWSEWRQRPALARIKSDTRERIANLFTIELNAHALFAPEFADVWVREPNAEFGGVSPIAVMLRGKVEDVITIRRYLERVRTASPSERSSSAIAETPENRAVSFLPGHAVAAADEDAALPALHHAAEIYGRLALVDPSRYRPAHASALHALAVGLGEGNEPEAVLALRQSLEIRRQLAAEESEYEGELLGGLLELHRRLIKLGARAEAHAVWLESRELVRGRNSLTNRERT